MSKKTMLYVAAGAAIYWFFLRDKLGAAPVPVPKVPALKGLAGPHHGGHHGGHGGGYSGGGVGWGWGGGYAMPYFMEPFAVMTPIEEVASDELTK